MRVRVPRVRMRIVCPMRTRGGAPRPRLVILYALERHRRAEPQFSSHFVVVERRRGVEVEVVDASRRVLLVLAVAGCAVDSRPSRQINGRQVRTDIVSRLEVAQAGVNVERRAQVRREAQVVVSGKANVWYAREPVGAVEAQDGEGQEQRRDGQR